MLVGMDRIQTVEESARFEGNSTMVKLESWGISILASACCTPSNLQAKGLALAEEDTLQAEVQTLPGMEFTHQN